MRNTYLNHLDDANYPFMCEVPWPKSLIRHIDVVTYDMTTLTDAYVETVSVVDGTVVDVVVKLEGTSYAGPVFSDKAKMVLYTGTPFPGLTRTYNGKFRLVPGAVRVSSSTGIGGVLYRTKTNQQTGYKPTGSETSGNLNINIGGALVVETDPDTGFVTKIKEDPSYKDRAFTVVHSGEQSEEEPMMVKSINGVNVPLSKDGCTLKIIVAESAIDAVPQLKAYLRSPTGETLKKREEKGETELSAINTYLGGHSVALCLMGTTAFPNCYGGSDDAEAPVEQ
jgi:hypothetical protein